ncbi:MAG TPA: MlaD family protein [Puia sp.]|nr:MlaD family protein [Puia sp.]
MKIANETKIGALATVAITLLILGFNFLKGKNAFEHSKKIYAVFKSVEGLETSNMVKIKGLAVGSVYDISPIDKDMEGIRVTINMKKDVHIPKNSVALIDAGLIGSASIIIQKGDATEFLKDGDTISTSAKETLLSEVQSNLSPVVSRLSGTLESLDSLIEVIGQMFDPNVKNNFSTIFANLARSSASLQVLLNDRTGALAHTMNHLDSFTNNLAGNSQKINNTLDNLEKTTSKLSNAKIDETLKSAQDAMNSLKEAVNKVNSTDGSLGLLINDKKLYNNLASTVRSLNTLLDDLRVHPKRYVSISVFGKKDKSTPLSAPLSDSTAKPPNPQ